MGERWRAVRSIPVLSLALIGLAADATSACTCMPMSPQAAFEMSSAVFSGRPVRSRPVADVYSTSDLIEYTFAVTNVWKGNLEDTLLTRACEAASRLAHSDSASVRIPGVTRIIELMDHPDFNVRAHAIFALQYFPSRALPLLPRLEAMNQQDPHEYVRHAARVTTFALTRRSLPNR